MPRLRAAVASSIAVAIALILVHPSAARAKSAAPHPMRATSYDIARRLDINSLNCFVTNEGWVGYDPANIGGGGGEGLFYPRGTTHNVLYAGGLWLGGLVGGAPRLAVAEYSSEYAPGTLAQGGAPANPLGFQFRVWKVNAWTGNAADTAHVDRTPTELAADPTLDPVAHHGWGEYMANAAAVGAPVRTWFLPGPGGVGTVPVLGPDVTGDQMLWCVFNDADLANHTNEAGRTSPLGVEVRQSVFAFNRPGPLAQALFIRWRIVNRSTQSIDAMRAACWLDPDIGGSTDDLAGCDTLRSLGFAYNATNADLVYGATPPALGVDLLDATYDAQHGRAVGMGVFDRYMNGTDPSYSITTWNYLNGLDADGVPIVNPMTLAPTTWMCSGDPVVGMGWVDTNPADRRILAVRPARTLAPGDSMDVVAAIIVGQGPNRLGSLAQLQCWDDWIQQAYASGFPADQPQPQACLAPQNCPRTPDWYAGECAGGTHLTAGQLAILGTGVDQQSLTLGFGSTPGAGFCTTLANASDVRAEAKAEYAALLANALATPLGVTPAGAQPIYLDTGLPVSVPGLAATTLLQLIEPAPTTFGLHGDYLNLDTTHPTPIAGVNAGLAAFGGGADYMWNFFGSSLDPTTMVPDSFPTIELRFDPAHPQKAYRYLRFELQDGSYPAVGRVYKYAGFVTVPFSAVDSATGRTMDIGFVERAVTDDNGTLLAPQYQPATFDSTWSPDASEAGGREYLAVLARPYQGTPRTDLAMDGAFYDGVHPWLYALWARRVAPDTQLDPADKFVFSVHHPDSPGADAALLTLESRSLADPAVTDAYALIRDGLAAINRGEGIGPTCTDVSTEVLASLVRADAQPTAVAIEWRVEGVPAVTVQRGERADEWTTLGTVAPTAGQVIWRDTDVVPGARYGYRLALGAGGAPPYAGETWLEVPRTAQLALAGFRPNPAGTNATIVFSLPGAGRATLEMLDVAGRRVLAEEVGALGPGTHALPLKGRPAPGIYWLRLTKGEQSAHTTGVIVR